MRTLSKLSWIELKLFIREPITMVFALAFPVMVLFVLGQAFGNTPDPEGEVFRGVGPMDYYTPAYIGLVMASVGLIAIPVHLTAYRERGVLRRLRASSVSALNLLGSQLFVSSVIILASAIILGVTAALVYGIHFPKSFSPFVLAFILGTVCFTGIGVLFSAVLPTPRAAQGVGLLFFFLWMFVAGAGPPPEVLGQPLAGIGEAAPLTHVIRLMQDPWLGFGWNNTALGIVLAFTGLAAILSLRFFRWE